MNEEKTDTKPDNCATPDSVGRVVGPVVRHLDLFSGIGGFALAARWVGGIETIGFCEIDPWAQKVLNKNFPGVPIHGDVKTLDPKNYERIDLITGGYPCQPFSVAGERKGKNDDRHLWPEVFRIIKTAKPRWVLCENVTGHVTMGLDEVLDDLESEGYAAEAVIIPASAVDAGHRRNRVWIIANSEREGWKGCVENDSLSFSKKKAHAELGNGIASTWGELGECRGSLRESDGLSVQMVRDQCKGAGNAIVPQVAAEILSVMMRVHNLPNVKDIGGGD